MTPAAHSALRMALSAVQAGVITFTSAVMIAQRYDRDTLFWAGLAGCASIANRIKEDLDKLPPIERERP